MNAVATLAHFKDMDLRYTPTSFEQISWIQWRKGKILKEDTPNWVQYPKPKSFRYKIMKFACDNAK